MSKEQIAKALDELRQRGFWDEDLIYESDEAFLLSPLGQFIMTLHELDPEALCWLTFFAAQRAADYSGRIDQWFRPRSGLASRYLSNSAKLAPMPGYLLRGIKLMQTLAQINQHLCKGTKINWAEATTTIPASINDGSCEWTDSEANAVANCARYIHFKEPGFAIDCILDADHALELGENDFRTWLTEVAIPAALQKRELTEQ